MGKRDSSAFSFAYVSSYISLYLTLSRAGLDVFIKAADQAEALLQENEELKAELAQTKHQFHSFSRIKHRLGLRSESQTRLVTMTWYTLVSTEMDTVFVKN